MTRSPPTSTLFPYTTLFRSREISATLELTHAVDPGELERHVQPTMVGGSNIFPPNDPAPHFTTTYGLHRRRSEEHTSELQSHHDLVCRLLLEKKNPEQHERK